MTLSFEILFGFALAHLMAAATPGPNFFLVSSLAMSVSRGRGVSAALGITFSVFIWSCAAALGLSLFLQSFPLVYDTIRYAGAAYLVWLGVKLMRNAFSSDAERTEGANKAIGVSILSAFGRGFLVNITNPKTITYYTSIFAVLVPQDASKAAFAEIVLTAVLVSCLWWAVVAAVFSTPIVARGFANVRRYVEFVAGSAFVLFGARVAWRP